MSDFHQRQCKDQGRQIILLEREVDALKSELARVKAGGQWISVEDDYPEPIEGHKILGFGNGYAFECEYEDGIWCSIGGETFTYWAPLTAPECNKGEGRG